MVSSRSFLFKRCLIPIPSEEDNVFAWLFLNSFWIVMKKNQNSVTSLVSVPHYQNVKIFKGTLSRTYLAFSPSAIIARRCLFSLHEVITFQVIRAEASEHRWGISVYFLNILYHLWWKSCFGAVHFCRGYWSSFALDLPHLGEACFLQPAQEKKGLCSLCLAPDGVGCSLFVLITDVFFRPFCWQLMTYISLLIPCRSLWGFLQCTFYHE